MSPWDYFLDTLNHSLAAQWAAKAGAAAGATEGSIGEEGQAGREQGSRVSRPSAGLPDAGTAILDQLKQPTPVSPGAAVEQTVQGIAGGGGPLAYLNQYAIWVLIALVGLVGLWGLVSPGGGVAVVARHLRR